MLGHVLLQDTGTLLRPLPLATAAETLVHVARLSPAAAAYHAAAGDAFDYAGTLVVATRDEDVLTGTPTTSVHFVDPAVVEHDAGGLLIALGSALPARRLSIRCAPDVPEPAHGRLTPTHLVAERLAVPIPPTRAPDVDTTIPSTREELGFARDLLHRSLRTQYAGSLRTAATPAQLDSYISDVVGFGDPARSMTVVVRWRGQLAGQLTWTVRADPLDRRRRAEIAGLTVLLDSGERGLAAALLAGMEHRVARVSGLAMRAVVHGPQATDDLTRLLDTGWTHTFTCRGMDPWMRAI